MGTLDRRPYVRAHRVDQRRQAASGRLHNSHPHHLASAQGLRRSHAKHRLHQALTLGIENFAGDVAFYTSRELRRFIHPLCYLGGGQDNLEGKPSRGRSNSDRAPMGLHDGGYCRQTKAVARCRPGGIQAHEPSEYFLVRFRRDPPPIVRE